MKNIVSCLTLIFAITFISCKQNTGQTTSESIADGNAKNKIVTPETYIRAETDREFNLVQKQTNGVNKLFCYRDLPPLDHQNVIRMNKDVLYSMAVVDTKGGATVVFPEMPDGRYASVQLIDNDHYIPEVIYTSGTYKLPEDTRYIGIAIRIQIYDANDKEEIAMINKLQDQFIIKTNSAEPVSFDWDMESLKKLTAEYNKEFGKYDKYPSDWQGKRGEVNEKTRHLAAAGAWGLFPERDATYINYNGGNLSGDGVYKATYSIPEYKSNGFWSLTVYGKDGYMKNENNYLNASNVELNPDGTLTVYFGSKENTPKDAKNRLDITDGWNFLMRVYLPEESVLNGSYKLPEVEQVK